MIGSFVMIVANLSQKMILCGNVLYAPITCYVKIVTKLLSTRINWRKKEFQKILVLLRTVRVHYNN